MPTRPRLSLRQELALALLPTVTVLGMLGGVEVFSRQRLLFASLASSAFLIYVDPEHPTNSVRTLVLAQGCAVLLGFGADWLCGAGYLAAGVAMVGTILVTVSLRAMHPPAVSTALTFAFRNNPASSLMLFGLALGLIVGLVVLERASLWLLRRYRFGPSRTLDMEHPVTVEEAVVQTAVHWLRLAVEATGAAVIGIGVVIGVTAFARAFVAGRPADFNAIRLTLARYLAMALEFQLGADILSTAVAPSWDEIGKLGAIAVIRTTLNYFLSREMEEERRTAQAERGVAARAAGEVS